MQTVVIRVCIFPSQIRCSSWRKRSSSTRIRNYSILADYKYSFHNQPPASRRDSKALHICKRSTKLPKTLSQIDFSVKYMYSADSYVKYTAYDNRYNNSGLEWSRGKKNCDDKRDYCRRLQSLLCIALYNTIFSV